MTCNFTYEHYIDTLKKYREYSKEVFLRHDIDVSIDNALELSILEHYYGFRATYFILFTSPFYNPLDPETRDKIMNIAAYHDIGLHYDVTKSSLADILKFADLLSYIIQKPITFACAHNVILGAGTNQNVKNKLNSIGIADMNDYPAKYISDSGRNWREQCMCKHIGKHKDIIILTHPEWWAEEDNSLYQSLLEIEKESMRKTKNDISILQNQLREYDDRLQIHRDW